MKKAGRDNRTVQMAGAVLAIVILYGVFFAVGIGCPIKFVTGISCPGCGMTRACASAVCGHWHEAWTYHPLFALPFLAVVYLALSRLIVRRDPHLRETFKKADKVLLWTAAAVMIVCYVWRMSVPGQDIVVCHPRDGAVYRLFSTVLR